MKRRSRHRDAETEELRREADLLLALRGTSEAADARFAAEAPELLAELCDIADEMTERADEAEKEQEKAEEREAATEETLVEYDHRLTRPFEIARALGILIAFGELLAIVNAPPPPKLASVHHLSALRKGSS